MQREFSQQIAAERRAENPLNVPPATPAAPKRYAFEMAGSTKSLVGAQGLCDPIESWSEDGFDYYYVSCNVVRDDGISAREPVPWPIRFSPEADPFNGTYQHDSPLPGPLPGWRPGSRDVITDDLRAYLHSQGLSI